MLSKKKIYVYRYIYKHFGIFTNFHSIIPPWLTYMGGLRLYGSQVVLQGQAAVVVKNGFNPDEMCLHQPLPLSRDLLLQRLQHGLEVLVEKR